MNQHRHPIRPLIRRGPTLAVVLVCAWLLAPGSVRAAENRPAEFSHPALIRFEGPITGKLRQFFLRKLDSLELNGADLVIVEIHSPGGLVDASLEIAGWLRDLDWAHTVAYVPREALSGAAIVALGCDEIIMGPNAVLGDAGPIFLAEDFAFRHAPEKFRSNLARQVRDLAKTAGRPTALVEAMVDMDLVVYRVKSSKTGRVTFMSDEEIRSDDDPEQWEKIKPVVESRKEHFLEVNGNRAVELGLADGNASSRDELKKRYKLKGELTVLEPTSVDTAVYILNLSLVTGLLLVIGLVALYVEFSAPGIGVGGLTAGLCFALFFWSRFLGGTADWLEVVLFLSGLAFLGIELFILPGFGVWGLSGVLLVLVSLILASQRFVIPQSDAQWTTFSDTLLVLFLSGGTFLVTAFFLSSYFGSIPLLSRLMLKPPEPNTPATDPAETEDAQPVEPTAHYAPKLGQQGIALCLLRPAGKARFAGQPVDVVADGDFITKGSRVEVAEISGNRIVVREVGSSA